MAIDPPRAFVPTNYGSSSAGTFLPTDGTISNVGLSLGEGWFDRDLADVRHDVGAAGGMDEVVALPVIEWPEDVVTPERPPASNSLLTMINEAFVTLDEPMAASHWPGQLDLYRALTPTHESAVARIHVAAPSLLPAFERIAEMAKLQANWDREHADPPTASAVSAADLLILAVAEEQECRGRGRVGPTTSSPIPDGGIQVEWDGPNARIDVQANPDGSYGFLVKWGTGRDAKYEEAEVAPLRTILSLVARVLAS